MTPTRFSHVVWTAVRAVARNRLPFKGCSVPVAAAASVPDPRLGRSSAVPHPHGVRNQPGSGRPQVWGIPLSSSLLSPMVWRGHDRLFTQPRAATSAVYGGSLAPLGLGCLPHSLQSGQGWAAPNSFSPPGQKTVHVPPGRVGHSPNRFGSAVAATNSPRAFQAFFISMMVTGKDTPYLASEVACTHF